MQGIGPIEGGGYEAPRDWAREPLRVQWERALLGGEADDEELLLRVAWGVAGEDEDAVMGDDPRGPGAGPGAQEAVREPNAAGPRAGRA
ncbi:MAG: hypothetical protein OEY14_05360 [Myxococcales bacterium]|nr:hypothetical protein [Myxococcales bacterium]